MFERDTAGHDLAIAVFSAVFETIDELAVQCCAKRQQPTDQLFARLNALIKVCLQLSMTLDAHLADARFDDLKVLWASFVAQSVVPALAKIVNAWLTKVCKFALFY